MHEKLLERFVKYAGYDTQSQEGAEGYPSTPGQLVLMRALAQELREVGCKEVEIDQFGYLTATIPATEGAENEPVIGFLAHVDTSPDMPGSGVKVQIHQNYSPEKPLRLGQSDYFLRVEDFAELALFRGHTLLTASGDTLLGADDKAGIAEIITAMEWLINHPEHRHGTIRVAFTPDEEIGLGVDHFDVQKFGADFAYTMDSGGEGCLEYENFNAAAACVRVEGTNFHPGYAKGKMVNAMEVLMALHGELPAAEKPENTEGREGFYHLTKMSGTVESATAHYIIRDHSRDRFLQRKELLQTLAKKHGAHLSIADQYYNMREKIEPQMHIVERALIAMKSVGVEPIVLPIRGGTDGARLSFMGLPCINLFTGGMNFHSRFEYLSLDSMERATRVIIAIAGC